MRRRRSRCLLRGRPTMRILRLAAAVLAACVLAGSAGAAVAMAQPGCADLQGVEGMTRSAGYTSTNPTYTLDFSLPDRLPRPAVDDRLPDADPRRLRQRRADARAYNLPYELDITATELPLGFGHSGRAPRAWCSRCTRTSVAHTRRPATRRSTGTSPRSSRSPSTRCSRRAPSRSRDLPIVRQGSGEGPGTDQPALADRGARSDATTRTSRSPTTR